MKLTQHEQDTLEMGLVHSGKNPALFDWYTRIAESIGEYQSVCKLDELGLVELRSISGVSKSPNTRVFLLRLTAKGDAVMRANWAREARGRPRTP